MGTDLHVMAQTGCCYSVFWLFVVCCLLLVKTAVATTMVIVVAFRTEDNNYDQLMVDKPPTNQQTRNCLFIVSISSLSLLRCFCRFDLFFIDFWISLHRGRLF